MNYEHMYTKTINRHLIHILDRSNRRQGVFGNNLMNISRPFQYKDHTAWPPLPSNLQWVDNSHTNPSERKYLVYYLVLSMSNKACHHIHQMKGFYHICFIRLTSMYLCIKKIKSTKVGATCVQGVLP